MSAGRVVATCGWCPTPLDPEDWREVAHHFLVQHNVTGSSSLRFFYPEHDELERAFGLPAAVSS